MSPQSIGIVRQKGAVVQEEATGEDPAPADPQGHAEEYPTYARTQTPKAAWKYAVPVGGATATTYACRASSASLPLLRRRHLRKDQSLTYA